MSHEILEFNINTNLISRLSININAIFYKCFTHTSERLFTRLASFYHGIDELFQFTSCAANLTIATFDFLRHCSLRIFSSNPIQASSSEREEVSARRRRFFLKDNRTRPLSFSAASPCISVARLSFCLFLARASAHYLVIAL